MLPGQFIPGADSHSRAYGAYGAVGIGVGSTTLGFGWSTGYIYFTLAKARRVVFTGRLNPWVGGKDIVLELLRRWGAKQSQGMSVEFVDADRQLPMVSRNTIANMMAEAEALNGIFAPDEVTRRVVPRRRASRICRIRSRSPARTRALRDRRGRSLWASVAPMIAKPFSPGNAFPAEEVARERTHVRQGADRIVHERQLRRSAAGGARAAGRARAGRSRRPRASSRCFPDRVASAARSSGPISGSAANRSPTSSAAAGAVIRQSWCGPCFGQGEDALSPGQRAITSFNRNWQNRMGLGGEGYLASPAVVAASALVGYMAPPSELGIEVEGGGVWRVGLRPLASGLSSPTGRRLSLCSADRAPIVDDDVNRRRSERGGLAGRQQSSASKSRDEGRIPLL